MLGNGEDVADRFNASNPFLVNGVSEGLSLVSEVMLELLRSEKLSTEALCEELRRELG